MQQHILEKLAATNPECEIWWDSSPLVYGSWVKETLAAAPENKKGPWGEQLARFINTADVTQSSIRGVTTNPPLSYAAIKDDPAFWSKYIRQLIEEHPGKGVEEIFWLTYKEVVRRGAEVLRPLWEKSGHKFGYISGQIDPRNNFDYDKMIAQARELAAIAPNVMVKLPGSKQGYQAVEEVTSWGVATNNTTSFTVPQYVACMEAVRKGVERAKKNGVDLFRFRSVITHMSDRYSGLGDLKAQAQARKIDLSEGDIRLAELAIYKRGYFIGKDKGYPSKMLMCSMRTGPKMTDGSEASWHIEKIAGSDSVYTCPPKYIAQLMAIEDKMKPFNPEAIHEKTPQAVMDKLMRIPYFVNAYEPDGLSHDDFNTHAAFAATATEFAAATRGMVDFVEQQFQEMGKWRN